MENLHRLWWISNKRYTPNHKTPINIYAPRTLPKHKPATCNYMLWENEKMPLPCCDFLTKIRLFFSSSLERLAKKGTKLRIIAKTLNKNIGLIFFLSYLIDIFYGVLSGWNDAFVIYVENCLYYFLRFNLLINKIIHTFYTRQKA